MVHLGMLYCVLMIYDLAETDKFLTSTSINTGSYSSISYNVCTTNEYYVHLRVLAITYIGPKHLALLQYVVLVQPYTVCNYTTVVSTTSL